MALIRLDLSNPTILFIPPGAIFCKQVVINIETQINTTKSDRSDTEELRCEISLKINKLIIHNITKVNKEHAEDE